MHRKPIYITFANTPPINVCKKVFQVSGTMWVFAKNKFVILVNTLLEEDIDGGSKFV